MAQAGEIAVYAVSDINSSAPSARHPVLLSYLDVVVQGYLQVFGRDGADHFFATTDGWDAPVLNDRAAPRYPRHQQLTREEIEIVDAHLAALAVKVSDII